MDLDFFERLSKAIAAQFGENCEVAVHDLLSGGGINGTNMFLQWIIVLAWVITETA